MKYLTACYRQQGEGTPSLLLQQFQCRGVPVCFACLEGTVAQGELPHRNLPQGDLPKRNFLQGDLSQREFSRPEGDALEEIKRWSRGFSWPKAVKRPEYWLMRAQYEWENMSGGNRNRTLLLAVGERILLLQGESGNKLYLINSCYGRGRAGLRKEDFLGSMEPGVGVLMSSPDFAGKMEENQLGKALSPGELQCEEQMEKRLRELGGQAAVLFLTKEGGRIGKEGAAWKRGFC